MTKREMQCFVIGVALKDPDYAVRMAEKLKFDDDEMTALTQELLGEFKITTWKALKKRELGN